MGINSAAMSVGLTITQDLDGNERITGIYGKELLLDCHLCDAKTFTRKSLRRFFNELVKVLDMKKGDLHFWDDVGVPKEEVQTKPETKGTSAIQFILTSNITIHCLDILERVYVNIFSCKDFDEGHAKLFVQEWFKSKAVESHLVYRK